MCIVVNKHHQPYDVYIGRGSTLGNPYVMDDAENTRDTVIRKYRLHLWREIKAGRITTDYLRSLQGKRLGCYCAPKPCHGDVIVKAVAWAMREKG